MEHFYECPKCREWIKEELKEVTLHTYDKEEETEEKHLICENCLNKLLNKKIDPVVLKEPEFILKEPEFKRKEITIEKREKTKSGFGMMEIE